MKQKRIVLAVLAIALMAFVLPKVFSPQVDPQERQESIEQLFNDDGSIKPVEEFVKSKMFSPWSYEHITTLVEDKEDYILVTTIYSGLGNDLKRNTEKLTVRLSTDGEIIKVVGAEVVGE